MLTSDDEGLGRFIREIMLAVSLVIEMIKLNESTVGCLFKN
jgi:hypothetical protein